MTPSEQMLEYVRRITESLEKMAGSSKPPFKLESLPQNEICNFIPNCPVCKKPMLLRKRKSDQSDFWGCRDFPVCKGTCNADGTPTRGALSNPVVEKHDNVPF